MITNLLHDELFMQTLLSLIGVCGLSSFLLYKFSNKENNSTFVRTIAFIGWFCGLSTLAVLRVDIAISGK